MSRVLTGPGQCGFNPRAHAGRDFCRHFRRAVLDVSIHAPTQGATSVFRPALCTCDVSIHAPTQGATFIFFVIFKLIVVSIHAPTQGATSGHAITVRRDRCFNPRAHAGRDFPE